MSYLLRRKGVGTPACQNIADSSQEGISVVRYDEGMEKTDVVFRWGTTCTIPFDCKIVNTAKAIHQVYDKRTSRKLFADSGLAPLTFIDFADMLDMNFGEYFPFIVRPEHHIRGKDLNICHNLEEVYLASKKYEKYYISKYVQKDKEFRVYIVSGRVIACIEKIPVDKNEVAWGCVDQGQFKYIPWNEWPKAVLDNALSCFKLTGLDFCAADIMIKDGKAYCLELNTAPEVTPYYGECFAKAFDYIIQNGKTRLTVPESQTFDFRNYIHPAQDSGAKFSKIEKAA